MTVSGPAMPLASRRRRGCARLRVRDRAGVATPRLTTCLLSMCFVSSPEFAVAAAADGSGVLAFLGRGRRHASESASEASVERLLTSTSPAAEIRRIVEAHRQEVRAGPLRPELELRRDLRLMLAQMGATTRAPAADLASSTSTINGWIGKVMWELDEKLFECTREQSLLLESATRAAEDTQELAAQTSYVRTEVLHATDEYPEDKEYFGSLKEQQRAEKRTCQEESKEHLHLLTLLKQSQDRLGTMRSLLKAECPSKGKLLQEASVARQAPAQNGAEHGATVQELLEVSRSSAEAAANATLAAAARPGASGLRRTVAAWASFLQVAESLAHQHRLRRAASGSAAAPSKEDYCASMMDALGTIVGEVEDDMALLEDDQHAFFRACEAQAKLDRREMVRTAHRRADVSQAMSEATGRLGTLTARARGRDEERRHLAEVASTARLRCKKEVTELVHHKLCGLVRLRDQLWLAAGKKELPQDCEVTDWESGECSTSCGGGVQNVKRHVLINASEGAACPPLVMERRCNEEKCPQHCVVSLWTGWSMCSAACDRGIQERTRVVMTKERHGGDPCPELVEMRACTAREACARDCELADWTKWSHCSQACEGGTQLRFRHVSRPPAGLGVCPADDDRKRLERRACNLHKCSVAADKYTCADVPVDVIVVVDVGGSLGQAGFDSLKKLTLELATRARPTASGARLGIVSVADDAEEVINLSPKLDDIEKRIKSTLEWRRGTTKLHTGLMRAAALLNVAAGTRGGVSSARGVPMVLVLTDGLVADPFLAKRVSKKFRGAGMRLMFGVFGGSQSGDKRLFAKAASQPAEENLFFHPSMAALDANMTSIAGKILRRMCGAVAPAQ